MSHAGLEAAIEAAWEARDTISPDTKGETRDAIEETLDALDAGRIRVAERMDFVECDLLPPHHEFLPTDLHFDLICANLPYIPSESLKGLPIFGTEPTLALDGGADGLDLVG